MILAKLKEATRIQHEQLETTVDVMNQTLDLTGYNQLLQNFYGFYAPLEPEIWRQTKKHVVNFDYETRLKTPLLRRDLQILNGENFAPDALTVCRNLPALDDFAQTLGCMYVLEGATLGGQFIARHLRQNFNLTDENGAAFFNSYGERVGQMWKSFGAMATAQAIDLKSDEEIINAARETFKKFEGWFKKSRSANV